MALLKKIYVFLVAMLFALCSPLFSVALSISPPLSVGVPVKDTLESKIDLIMSPFSMAGTPGAVIGIIYNKKLVFVKGYGMADLQTKKVNHPDRLYKIASVSKQFTAAATLALIRQQKLKLTDDVRKYLPGLPQYSRTITIADLLYHTSGIRDYMVLMWLNGRSFEEKFSNEDALQMIYRQRKLHFTTGTRCIYSNSNYVLLAAVIEKVSGKTLAEFAEAQIFQPLRMKNTGYGSPKEKLNERMTMSYGSDESSFRVYQNQNQVAGDGGIHTTIQDLLEWDKTFYDSTSLANGILVRGKLDNGGPLTYGMGIMHGNYKNSPIQMHPGAFLGYRAEMLRFPEKQVTIVCLGNNENIDPEEITRQIAEVYVFKGEIQQQKSSSISDTDERSLVGKYEVATNVFIDIKFENKKLSGQVTGQARQFLHLKGKNTYGIGDSGDLAIFSETHDGKMQVLSVVQNNRTTVAKRPELISGKDLDRYVGEYHSEEQQTSYRFYLKNGGFWFKVGNGPEVRADILKKYDRLHFGYQNLEQATVDFQYDNTGKVTGFVLNSGRVSDLNFKKI